MVKLEERTTEMSGLEGGRCVGRGQSFVRLSQDIVEGDCWEYWVLREECCRDDCAGKRRMACLI